MFFLRSFGAVLFVVLFSFGTAQASDCRSHLKSEDLRQPDEISLFLQEFRAQIDDISPALWRKIFEQIRQINFKASEIPPIEFSPQKSPWIKRRMPLDPLLIEGWWKLGFINDDGSFNFAASREEIAHNLREITGYETTFEPAQGIEANSGKPLGTHQVFIADFLNAKIHLTELHDFILHAPWYLSKERREWFNLAARFDQILDRIGQSSVLNALFEYGSHSRLETLRGPFQLIYGPAFNFIPIEGVDLRQFLHSGLPLDETEIDPEVLMTDFILYVWKFGAQNEESLAWYVACQAMYGELWRLGVLGKIPDERRAEVNKLKIDLIDMILKLEGVLR